MYIKNPDPFLLPSYRISPFRTADISFNISLPDDETVTDYFKWRFKGSEYYYTYNGRDALHLALSYYKLNKDDIVTILTTTGNKYISNCVTGTIEKFCTWSRKIESKTRVILINHEFGYPFEELKLIKQNGIPIIEDRAHSFFLSEEFFEAGTTGDFVIYSFPKMFPLQVGGLLVKNAYFNEIRKSKIDKQTLRYIKNVLSYHLKIKDEIINERLNNYDILRTKLRMIGLSERFTSDNRIVPGVFMFRMNNMNTDLQELKNYLNSHGIQSSVFYGEESFFVPVNQSLNEKDLEYFKQVIQSFINC